MPEEVKYLPLFQIFRRMGRRFATEKKEVRAFLRLINELKKKENTHWSLEKKTVLIESEFFKINSQARLISKMIHPNKESEEELPLVDLFPTFKKVKKTIPEFKARGLDVKWLSPMWLEITHPAYPGRKGYYGMWEQRERNFAMLPNNQVHNCGLDELKNFLMNGCSCGKKHKLFGMEVEFDAPFYARLHSDMQAADIPFEPLGRDGAGQGEVRAMPSDDFQESAKSLLENLRKGMTIVRESQKEYTRVKRLYNQIRRIAKNIDLQDQMRIVNDGGRPWQNQPNGLHFHAPTDPYFDNALRLVALWWNQSSKQHRTMLDIRMKNNYGHLYKNAVRQSQVCKFGMFTEYRFFNGPVTRQPDKNLERLMSVLDKVVKEKPSLPSMNYEKLRYGTKNQLARARKWCIDLVREKKAPVAA